MYEHETDIIMDPMISEQQTKLYRSFKDATCQALLTKELALEELALQSGERLTARQCSRGACLSDGALSGSMTTRRNNFLEATVESVGRCARDWYYKQKD